MKPTRRRRNVPPVEAVDADVEYTELGTAAELDVSVEGVTPEPPKSSMQKLGDRLKAALLGGGSDSDDEPTPGKPLNKKKQDEVAQQIMVLLAILMCWLSDSMFYRFAAPYQPVGPQQNEAQAMSLPLARMAARRLKINGKVSDDTLDLLMFMTAIASYADRARDTAREISATIRERETNAVDATTATNGHNPVARQAAPNPYSQERVLYGTTQQNAGSAKNHGDADTRQNGTQHQPDTRSGDNLMDELLRADALGRKERGLI